MATGCRSGGGQEETALRCAPVAELLVVDVSVSGGGGEVGGGGGGGTGLPLHLQISLPPPYQCVTVLLPVVRK